jgi:hypothetical protein
VFKINTYDDREALSPYSMYFIDYYNKILNDKYKKWRANIEEKEFLDELEQLSSIRPKSDSNVSLIDYKDSCEMEEDSSNMVNIRKPIINNVKNNIAKGSIFLKKRDTKITIEEKSKIDVGYIFCNS